MFTTFSRAFVARSVWQQMGDDFLSATAALRYGDVTDLTNYGGAVIDERSFAKNVNAIERAKSAAGVTVAVGVNTRRTVYSGRVDPKVTEALNQAYRGNLQPGVADDTAN